MKKRSASVLIFILFATLFLSVIIVYVMKYAVVEMRLRAPIITENSIRHEAYNVLYSAISELTEYVELDKALYSFEQGWGALCADGRAHLPASIKYKVVVSDETAKLPLQSLSSKQLQALFYELELPESELKSLADRFIDWTDKDDNKSIDGAEKDDYEMDGPMPPNRPLRSFSELKNIDKFAEYFFDEKELPNETYKKIVSAVSLYTTGTVNFNNTSELVLRALFKMDETEYDNNILPAIKGEMGTIIDGVTWVKSAAELSSRGTSLPSKFQGFTANLIKIDVYVSRGVSFYKISALCEISSNSVTVKELYEGGKD